MRLRMTLAGQFLALQLVIVLVVLLGVVAVSLAQSAATFQRVEGRRVLAVAESVAATSLVRLGLDDPATQEALAALTDGAQSVSGASFVIIARPDRTILTSPDPRQIGGRLPLGGSSVLQGRSWTGVVTLDGTTAVVAHVPVIDDDQRVVGIVAVGRDYPTVSERLRDATPNLVTYVGLASALGVVGSWLLARRVKRQTLGLEPREITGLVEHREAMLHGIKEGVVSLDPAHRITLVNDGARELLDLPEDCVGRTLEELHVDRRLYDVLTGGAVGSDQVVVVGERVLTLNRMPMSSHGKVIGSVTTLRDRTELVSLQRELGTTRNTTDTLRAQTHEFANQLHTISGLIQLGEYAEVVRFVNTLSQMRAQLSEDVTSRIADPALAALLIAKSSLASERGAGLRISEASRLPRVDERLSADLTTVVGNLVDNALDAIGPVPGGWVEVHLREDGGVVHLVVRDSGPGVAPELAEEVFRHGFTTKAAAHVGQRGFGLALTQLVCSRRGGDVSVHNDDGAVFTARIPIGDGVAP
jgi:sensor histidine kinase regulating citrate/malate metabolism